MKTAIKQIVVIGIVAIITFSMDACSNGSTKSKTLVSIAVTTEPTQTSYKIGEDFDPAGMVVTATYDDGSSVPVTDYTTDADDSFDSDTVGVKTITVSYNGKVTSFEVTVVKTLESIAVTTQPVKTIYILGETFDSTGMVVTATYDDGSLVPVADYTTDADDSFDSNTVGVKTITVSYNDKEASFEVTVVKTLESIAVTTEPTKTTYIIGEEFDPEGMVVTAYYDDDSSESVTGYTISFDSGTAGTKTVTVSYNGKETILEVTVQQQEKFSITFNKIADAAPNIEGPTIYLHGREGKPTEGALELEDPEQYDSNSIKWYVTGTTITGSGGTFTLKSSDYTRIGDYFLTVEVKKNGIPYNQTITFTVAP